MCSFRRPLSYLLCVLIPFFPGIFPEQANADSIDDYVISFETTDCNGQIGMGLVKITEIFRINPYQCPGGERAAQLLTKTEDSESPASVFIISPEEVKLIREEVRAWQAVKRQQLLNTERIIIN